MLAEFAFIVCSATSARAQTALDGFDPNANGTVMVVVVQPDGKILIGGNFTKLSPNGGPVVARNRIARLNPDGTLDTAFDPNSNSDVFSIAVQADGKILAGGDFIIIGGQARNAIARLDATTGAADSWDPNSNGNVQTIAVQPDGKVLAGGNFRIIGGQPRNFIARLDPVSGFADSFNPNSNGSIRTIVVQADSKILASGVFRGLNSIGGQTRNFVARLDPVSGFADSFDPNPNGDVYSIAVQADGRVLAGGNFIIIGGQARNKIARLDATTGAADSWDPNSNGFVYSIAVESDGKVLAGGTFANIGGQTRNRIARLDATTGAADSWDPNSNGDVYSIGVQANGKILVGGLFANIGGQTRNNIARVAGPTIQFSAANYNVGEGDGRVTLTVTRSGDASAAPSVGFATSDNAGSQGCNVFNGLASSRCDYMTSIGTVQFAAGETFKTISIPIIDDSYAEGNETFTVSLNNAAGASLGTQSTTTVMIVDNDSVAGPNPVDQSSFFVRQHYLDFLNREPDPSGLNFWVSDIESCGADANCRTVKRIDASAAFFLSIEFQQTGYLVERIYKASYGDAIGASTFPSAHQLSVPIVRLNEFLPDTQEIGRGVIVNQTGWETALENNKQAFTLEFVQRSRFTAAFPTSMTPSGFVDKLFLNAGVTPSASDRTAAINEFGSATTTSDVAARSRALRRVAENSTLNQQEFNRAFVLMQFLGYLRRNPNDTPDADYTGYDFWLTKLNQFNGNYANAEMVKAFIVSSEDRQRFGP
jgi:uncharacterized delta-60 repeat protein